LLLGHVRDAPWAQFLDEGFHGATERVIPMSDAILFQQSQHAIAIRCASDIDGIFGQLIHGGEITSEPVSVGEIETIASSLEKGLTQF